MVYLIVLNDDKQLYMVSIGFLNEFLLMAAIGWCGKPNAINHAL